MIHHWKDKPDVQIQDDVLQELRWDARNNEPEVKVHVGRGFVILTGAVGSYAKKLAAEEAAHRVAGVLDVANDLQVKALDGSPRSDAEIAQAVRRALEWDALVWHESIRATVEDGWVILEGTPSSLTDSRYAERVVGGLIGVRGVINKFTVAPIQSDSEQVWRSIEAALERLAERQSHRIRHEAKDIRVEVKGGRVSLSGEVATWHEKEAALGAAGHAPGIHAVEDHLLIKPIL